MTKEEIIYLKSIGKKIAFLRKEKGFTQIHICDLIDMEKSNLSAIENGRQNATTLTLRKIALAINVEVADFFKKGFDSKEKVNEIH